MKSHQRRQALNIVKSGQVTKEEKAWKEAAYLVLAKEIGMGQMKSGAEPEDTGKEGQWVCRPVIGSTGPEALEGEPLQEMNILLSLILASQHNLRIQLPALESCSSL